MTESRILGRRLANALLSAELWKLFQSTCFRGDDSHYYCSEACASEGFNADLAVVEPIRKRS